MRFQTNIFLLTPISLQLFQSYALLNFSYENNFFSTLFKTYPKRMTAKIKIDWKISLLAHDNVPTTNFPVCLSTSAVFIHKRRTAASDASTAHVQR